MAPLTSVPSLDEIASDPARVRGLSRSALADLAIKAVGLQTAIMTALLAAPAEAAQDARLITTAELAKRMGVSANYVYDHRHEWPFTIEAPGMRPVFSLRGFEAWVAERDGRAVLSSRATARKGA